jgi:glucokinase
VLFAPNLAWRDEPLRSRVEAEIDLPVVVENDVNAAAWGEFRFGAGSDVDDQLMVAVGTGIGGGIIVDGELIRGSFGVAAEVGHLRVVPQGILCGCGQHGCWEQYASGRALVREARDRVWDGDMLLEAAQGDPGKIDGQMITKAAGDGDPLSVALLADLGSWLGQGIASLAAVLDPGVVVIGGGVSEAGDLLLGPIRKAFDDHLSGGRNRPQLDLRLATLGNQAGMIGAADLARKAG